MSDGKTAIILAGGKGARLRPYTVVLPKPLMPIGDHPILEIIVRQLKYFGFRKLIFAVNHQAELIRAFFGTGDRWGVDISYSLEDSPLGTMGPLRLIPKLPNNFLIMNGDILCDIDYAQFYADHVSGENIFTVSSCMRTDHSEYGVLDVDDGLRLVNFREKPAFHYRVSMGVYAAKREIVDMIPEHRAFGFDELMHELIRLDRSVFIRPHNGKWFDIGIVSDHQRACEAFEAGPSLFLHEN